MDTPRQSQEARAQTLFGLSPGETSTDPFGYLVDLAAHPDALRLLFERDSAPSYDLLYLYSGYREEAQAGPLLIEPLSDECDIWLKDYLQHAKALALYGANLTVQQAGQHLASLNTVQTPWGSSLFRYADPSSLRSLGPSLDPAQRQRILGPFTAIRGYYANQGWALHYLDDIQPGHGMDTSGPLTLSDHNFRAAEDFRKGLLAKAIAESGKRSPELTEQWFRQLEGLGAPSEQALVEGAEILIRAALTRPLTESELSSVRTSGKVWSDRLEALALINQQEGS